MKGKWCDGQCTNKPTFGVRLRGRDSDATEMFSEVCGRHIAWAVRALEGNAADLTQWRKERGVVFEGVVVVATLSPSRSKETEEQPS